MKKATEAGTGKKQPPGQRPYTKTELKQMARMQNLFNRIIRAGQQLEAEKKAKTNS